MLNVSSHEYALCTVVTWLKVQNFQNPELSDSNLKTCIMPNKYSLFQV